MLDTVKSLESLYEIAKVSDKRVELLEVAVGRFDAEVAADKIYNVTATEAKDALYTIQRMFEQVREIAGYQSADALALGDLYHELPYSIDGGTCKKGARNLQAALQNTSLSPSFRRSLELQLTITTAFCTLTDELRAVKAKLIKGRVPKATSEDAEDADFTNKVGSKASVELITAKLTEITKTPLDQFEAGQTACYQLDVDAVLRRGASFPSTDLTPDSARALSSCFDFKVTGFGKTVYFEVTANEKAATYAAECGKKAREGAEQSFLYKAALKLSNIVDKKGNLASVVGNADCTRGVVTAYLTFSFADGSTFSVKHKVIVNSTARGDRFYQVPTTFHDVKLANGNTIAFPSEEKLVTVFAA